MDGFMMDGWMDVSSRLIWVGQPREGKGYPG